METDERCRKWSKVDNSRMCTGRDLYDIENQSSLPQFARASFSVKGTQK
jgi:hypothetical protein